MEAWEQWAGECADETPVAEGRMDGDGGEECWTSFPSRGSASLTAHTRSRLLGSFECTQDDATPPIKTLHRCSALARVGGLPKHIPKRPGDEQTAEMATFRNCYKGLAADGSALDEGDIAENVSINFSGQNAQRGENLAGGRKQRVFCWATTAKKKEHQTLLLPTLPY